MLKVADYADQMLEENLEEDGGTVGGKEAKQDAWEPDPKRLTTKLIENKRELMP